MTFSHSSSPASGYMMIGRSSYRNLYQAAGQELLPKTRIARAAACHRERKYMNYFINPKVAEDALPASVLELLGLPDGPRPVR
jgi:hypothetical protein